ncbi:hypothetical protein CXF80_04985 [Shewanella sp. Actino-trap-3]|nr:hypothetical protein CXF80_04985 [Shewanella sp. Actino-trap-3]
MHHMEAGSRRIQFISIPVTLLIMAIVYYSFNTGRDIAVRYSPLVDAAMEIKLEATTAHLWFEEAISGDPTIDIDAIWTHLDQSAWYAQAMLDGGVNNENTFLALNDPHLRLQIEDTIVDLQHFRQIAQLRWNAQSTSGIGSNIDQQFDQAFLEFNLAVDHVQTTLQKIIINDLQTFKFMQQLLMALILIVGLVILGLLLRYNTRINNHILALHKQEESLRITLNSIGDAVIVTDTHGTVTYINPVAIKLTGYTAAQAIGQPLTAVFNIIHALTFEPVNNPVKKVLETGLIVGLANHTMLIAKDGSEYQIADSGAPIRNPAGDISGVVLVFRDVTEEHTLFSELESSQALIKTLLNTVPDMIWLKDAKGVYLGCNSKFERMVGAREHEIVGKTDYDFVDHELANFFRNNDDKALIAGEATVNEESLTFADDGHIELVETIKTPMRDNNGHLIGILGVARDVTNYKKSLAQLKESETRLIEAQVYAQIGYWELLADQKTAIWSDQMYALFGLVQTSKAGPETICEVMNKSDFPTFIASVKECFFSGKEHHVEFRIIRPCDGEERWIECRGKVVTDSDGKPQKISGFIQDITESKKAEETLRQSEATIRNKLKAILEPDADIDALALSDIIDAEALQSLMDDFYDLTGMLGAILDIKGNILVAVGWQDICTQFHRCHPDTRKNCLESDLLLTHGVEHGTFKEYNCKNNMFEMVTPIVIGDKHLGNVFIGQFFYQDEVPDVELFRKQANNYGFDEQEYLAALDRVPRFTRNEVTRGMHFYAKLADIISTSSFSAIKQSRLLAEQKKTEEKLQLSFRVFSDTHEGIIITDAQQHIVDVNPAFSQITGYSREDIIGKTPAILRSGKHSPQFYSAMWQTVSEHGYWLGEVWNRTKQGQLYAELLTISSLTNEHDEVTHYVGMFSDITSSKQQQDQLNMMAHYDVLTKLPNRALFVDRFQQSIAHSLRTGHQLAVCFFDLDDFKPVNDNYGHEAGDRLLIEVANRITVCIREEDTVSRQGGDEFAILLNDIELASQYEATIKRIHQALAQPYFIDDVQHHITVSSGVTLYPSDNADIDTLLRHADHAMYQSKLAGKDRSRLYSPDSDQRIIQKNHLLEEIEQALGNHEFQLYYQPKVNMVSGHVFGVEALIRWIHPGKGLIPPLDFLPFIDGTPLEVRIGEWVINEALQQLDDWKLQGVNLEVSVNISSNHLLSPSFVVNLEKSLAKYPSNNSQYLQLEILESSAFGDINTINHIIETCQNRLGVSFALDDFGTGYSSLTHLRSLPVNTIKIDQRFVFDMLDNPSDYSIIEGVIALTKSFNRNVIAEGVESTEHGLMLLLMGCEQAQGYGIAKPMPAKAFLPWLSNYTPNKNWRVSGNKHRNNTENSLAIFTMLNAQWKETFRKKIVSSPDDHALWPILDVQSCQCGNWIRREKQRPLFETQYIQRLEQAHNNIHFIAHAIQHQYQQGNIDTARNSLVNLELAFDDIINVLSLS